MRMAVRKFFGLFGMLTLSMLAFGVIATLALGVFSIAVSMDLAGMQAWIGDRETPLAALRMAVYAATVWFGPVWLRLPKAMHRNLRINGLAMALFVEVLFVRKLWQYF